MASKPKRDKKHRPRAVHNPVDFILSGLKRVDGELQTDLNARNHAAMQALVQGRGTRDSWDQLVGAINMANVLCEQGIGNEYRDQMLAGRDALAQVRVRYDERGVFVFKADEMQAVNLALEVHDAQLEAARVVDIERAGAEVLRRIRYRVNALGPKSLLASQP